MPEVRATKAVPPPATTDGQARSTSRDPFFDNAKYLAIVLVAIGHAWTPLREDSRTMAALYMFVYAFHMPAFIMIAGYFSRNFTARPHQLRRLVSGVLAPYLIFGVAYVLFVRWGTDSPDYPFALLDPYYLTWFLIALFVWRITAPLWNVVRWPMPIALTVAALASFTPSLGNDLNIQRVLQFLPFFVLGMRLRPEHFELVRRREVRLAALPVLLGALVTAYWAVPRMDAGWFYRSSSAQEMGFDWWIGVVMSLALFGCGLVLSVAFLSWVPRRRRWYTALGAGTIYGYLLHGFVVKASRWWEWYDVAWVDTPGGRLAVTALGALVVTLLCTAPVRRVFRFMVEPSLSWVFRGDDETERKERGAGGERGRSDETGNRKPVKAG
ncbi:acyltransferase family protein [Streptomyces sp. NBRC 109706]|uniref:acyltransferase family protein n=1 Tax=Streptomyces sp. NBRC 109706 TaxID=1550035 RepID=UPI00082F927F|nr:acyltransferase family protein [Streptomyces sp. NBRC 109706]